MSEWVKGDIGYTKEYSGPDAVVSEYFNKSRSGFVSTSTAGEFKRSFNHDNVYTPVTLFAHILRMILPVLALAAGQVALYVMALGHDYYILIDEFMPVGLPFLIASSVCAGISTLFVVLGTQALYGNGNPGYGWAYVLTASVMLAGLPSLFGFALLVPTVLIFAFIKRDFCEGIPAVAAATATVCGAALGFFAYYNAGFVFPFSFTEVEVAGVTAIFVTSLAFSLASLWMLAPYAADMSVGGALGITLPYIVLTLTVPLFSGPISYVYLFIVGCVRQPEPYLRESFVLAMLATCSAMFITQIALPWVLLAGAVETIIYIVLFNYMDACGKEFDDEIERARHMPAIFISIAGALAMLVFAAIRPELVMPNIREMNEMVADGLLSDAYPAAAIADARLSMISGAVVSGLAVIAGIIVNEVKASDDGVNIRTTAASALSVIGAIIGFILVNFTLDLPKNGYESEYLASDWAILKGIVFTLPGVAYHALMFFISGKAADAII